MKSEFLAQRPELSQGSYAVLLKGPSQKAIHTDNSICPSLRDGKISDLKRFGRKEGSGHCY